MGAPSKGGEKIEICRADDVPDGDARGFDVCVGSSPAIRLIVVRQDPAIFVYLNRCPHRGTPLDWVPDRFLDVDRQYLVCATHGALFRAHDGVCVAGPCHGDGLRPVAVELRDGVVYATSLPTTFAS
jgi:nitrite reductase/ring-hydroxylating ferredoxin subunit